MTSDNTGLNIGSLQAFTGEFEETGSIEEAFRAAGLSGKADYRHPGGDTPYDDNGGGDIGCAVKQLPSRLVFQAAEVAARLNPINAPVVGRSAAVDDVLPTPLAAAVATLKYWGPTPRS